MPKARSDTGKKAGAGGGECCGEDCCSSGSGCCGTPPAGCCQVAAVVGIDARGQMVLPKDLRTQAGIRADDKLAVVTWKKREEVCCLMMVKVDALAEAIRTAYGPMLSEIVRV
jgi:antitoxin PrlF